MSERPRDRWRRGRRSRLVTVYVGPRRWRLTAAAVERFAEAVEFYRAPPDSDGPALTIRAGGATWRLPPSMSRWLTAMLDELAVRRR